MKFLDETGLKFIATKLKELRKSLIIEIEKTETKLEEEIDSEISKSQMKFELECGDKYAKKEDLTNKVDKVTGKDLSTNDYTNEAKAKVDAIPENPKYTDTVQDLSEYAKKKEIQPDVFHIDQNDTILTDMLFQNKYLNKKIESKMAWDKEFFPRGVYAFRMESSIGAPPENNFDFIVLTSFNANVDVFDDDIEVHSYYIEQIALSSKTGRVYNRYIRNDGYGMIEHGYPSDDTCKMLGVRGKWTDWKEITKDFAMKEDITNVISTLTTFKKEIVTSLPSTGKDNVFYLLKDANGKDNNNYLEYLWIDNKWEMIGSTQVDLTNYAKKEDITALNNVFVTKDGSKVLSDFNFSGGEKLKLQQLPSADEFAIEWEKKANKTELKTKLSEMTDDSTHRLVTDTEKTTWNNKLDSVSGKDISRSKTKGYNTSNTWSSLSTNRDLEDWIGDFDKRTRENKDALSKYKQQVILTQAEYDKLSSTDKNDDSKMYFIKG